MRTITLQIDDSVSDKFLWLLDRFSRDEIKILEQSDYVSDDEYLREIEGMVQSINSARTEPIEQGITLDKLDW
ncbi:MAG: hypothetical protein M1G31_09680 [Pseudanabaena sp. Salubria-1]|jgi:hypothetical protein|nr:hypothetical protein [Pseudanabaena sp. Salubria-1]